MTDHTLKSFATALSDIDAKFARMGERVVDMVEKAVAAIVTQDRRLALSVVETDLEVDGMFEEIRADCFDVILKFQPVARDLRQVMSIEHAVGDLERIGDHAKNMAKAVISAEAPVDVGPDSHLSEMAALVVASLRQVLQAMAARDSASAGRVISGDARIDALNETIFDRAMVEVAEAMSAAEPQIRLLFMCKALERIGDHATNIAEEVRFLARGMPAGATRSDLHG